MRSGVCCGCAWLGLNEGHLCASLPSRCVGCCLPPNLGFCLQRIMLQRKRLTLALHGKPLASRICNPYLYGTQSGSAQAVSVLLDSLGGWGWHRSLHVLREKFECSASCNVHTDIERYAATWLVCWRPYFAEVLSWLQWVSDWHPASGCDSSVLWCRGHGAAAGSGACGFGGKTRAGLTSLVRQHRLRAPSPPTPGHLTQPPHLICVDAVWGCRPQSGHDLARWG